MTLIRRAQQAAATAESLPVELPAHHRRTLDDMSGATLQELEDACVAVEFLSALANLDCSDPEGR